MNVMAENDLQFLAGGGEMGELTRSKDWSTTPVGDPETWPQSLRTTLGIILNSKFPMFLWWGPELTCFYNDAYRPSLGQDGKHPSILGMNAVDAWPEIWHIIKPLIDKTLQGEAVWFEDLLVPIYRNGKIEDVYWTFSYSPVNDESDEVAGVLVTCTETTGKVNILKELEESKNQLQFAIEASEMGTWELNVHTGEVHYSKRYLEIVTGNTEHVALTHEQLKKHIHPDDLHIRDKALADAYRTGHLHYESRLIWDDGSIHWMEGMGKVFYDDDKKPFRLMGTIRDTTEQKEHERELEESEGKFRLLADSMPQHIWTSDTEGNLNYYNRSVFDYSGLTPEQVEKEGWLQIVHPDDREENIKQWMHAVSTGSDFLFEHRFRRHDGMYRWMLSRAIPQRDETGKIQMWVGTSTDIQDIKEMDRQKDSFLSMASHELKTPVTTIKAYGQIAEAMLQKKGDTETLAMINKMGTQVNKLTNLIRDLLDITRIQKGKLHYTEAFFDMNDLVKEVVDDMQKTSATHRIQNTAGDDIKVYGDREKIGQVLNNLISNAIKYSPQADSIAVSTQPKDNGVIISVQDFGIGIPAKEKENVFEQFYRVTGNNQATFPGMGIGLFICSEIVKMHGGKIWAESVMGKGSTFYTWLPVDHRERK